MKTNKSIFGYIITDKGWYLGRDKRMFDRSVNEAYIFKSVEAAKKWVKQVKVKPFGVASSYTFTVKAVGLVPETQVKGVRVK